MKEENEENVLTDKQLARLYPLVKDFHEAPLNNAVLATGLGIDEQKSFHIFKAFINKGILVKKYVNINVYKLTQNGLKIVFDAYKRVTQQKDSNTSLGSPEYL
jgi:hypothetical protein